MLSLPNVHNGCDSPLLDYGPLNIRGFVIIVMLCRQVLEITDLSESASNPVVGSQHKKDKGQCLMYPDATTRHFQL